MGSTKRTSGDLLTPLGAQNKGLQTLVTGHYLSPGGGGFGAKQGEI